MRREGKETLQGNPGCSACRSTPEPGVRVTREEPFLEQDNGGTHRRDAPGSRAILDAAGVTLDPT